MTRKLAALGFVVLSACQAPIKLPHGEATFKSAIPAPPGKEEYRITRGDTLSVNVFQEPDLSTNNLRVDSGGYVAMPLIGQVSALNKTGPELAQDITRRLASRYLVSPNVTVNVVTPSAPKVIVEGSVTNPGVYDIRSGQTTLLEAIALAAGPTRTAKLSQVVIFREVEGQRMGALFDVAAIRRGEAPDPLIMSDDTVVLGYSNIKSAWRDFLQAAPIIGVFTRF
ncbi:polysaccharide biosynthesis/export family protein [Flavisphingomonas formosensis]|uniref:polysaccharide biosynthesis/export family protein n=1 Tax=Flavisphingomonas formosensis TaxID=861534 RepID=UPI0012F797DE|nr:polysaccharide biosynthesis/export family protein [Sphingomonas formosensis]